jgi:hypothetical protein
VRKITLLPAALSAGHGRAQNGRLQFIGDYYGAYYPPVVMEKGTQILADEESLKNGGEIFSGVP